MASSISGSAAPSAIDESSRRLLNRKPSMDKPIEIFCIDTGDIQPLLHDDTIKLEHLDEATGTRVGCEISYIDDDSNIGVTPLTKGCFVNGTLLDDDSSGKKRASRHSIAPSSVIVLGSQRFQLRYSKIKSGRRLPVTPGQQTQNTLPRKMTRRHQKVRNLTNGSSASGAKKPSSTPATPADNPPAPAREIPTSSIASKREEDLPLETVQAQSAQKAVTYSPKPVDSSVASSAKRMSSSTSSDLGGWVMGMFSVMVWESPGTEDTDESSANHSGGAETGDQVAEIISHELILSNPATAASLIDRVFKAIEDCFDTSSSAIQSFLQSWTTAEEDKDMWHALLDLIRNLLSVGMDHVDTWLGTLLLLKSRMFAAPGVVVPSPLVGLVVGALSAGRSLATVKLACRLLQEWCQRKVHMPNGTGEILCVVLQMHDDSPDIIAMVCQLLLLLADEYPEINEAREAMKNKTRTTLNDMMGEFKQHDELQKRGSAWLSSSSESKKGARKGGESQKKKKKPKDQQKVDAETPHKKEAQSSAPDTAQKTRENAEEAPQHDLATGQQSQAAISTRKEDTKVTGRDPSGSPSLTSPAMPSAISAVKSVNADISKSPRTRRSLPTIPGKVTDSAKQQSNLTQHLLPSSKSVAAVAECSFTEQTTPSCADETKMETVTSPITSPVTPPTSQASSVSAEKTKSPLDKTCAGEVAPESASVHQESNAVVNAVSVGEPGHAPKSVGDAAHKAGTGSNAMPANGVRELSTQDNDMSTASNENRPHKALDKEISSSDDDDLHAVTVVEPDATEERNEKGEASPPVQNQSSSSELELERPAKVHTETAPAEEVTDSLDIGNQALKPTDAAAHASTDEASTLTPRTRRRSEWSSPNAQAMSPLSPLSPKGQLSKVIDEDEAAAKEVEAEHEDVANSLSRRTMGVRLARQNWEAGQVALALRTAFQLLADADIAGYLDVISMLLKQIYRWPHDMIVEAMTSLGSLNLSTLSPRHVEVSCNLMTILSERLLLPPEADDATDSNQDEPSACLANARDATRDFFSRHGDTPETGSEWRPAWNAVDTLNKRLTLGEQV